MLLSDAFDKHAYTNESYAMTWPPLGQHATTKKKFQCESTYPLFVEGGGSLSKDTVDV